MIPDVPINPHLFPPPFSPTSTSNNILSNLDADPFKRTAQQQSEARQLRIQELLNKKLGPEYVSTRTGPSGGPKLTYIEGWKAIDLANEVFGYNGWFTEVKSMEIDYTDFNAESCRWSIGVSACVRVWLRDGGTHEDVGYGKAENVKSKGDALDKCRKEAMTDGLKRALRSFGPLLGNCMYDKNYTSEITKVKAVKPKFVIADLHRPHNSPLLNSHQPNANANATASTSTASTTTTIQPSTAAAAPPPRYRNPPPQQQQQQQQDSADVFDAKDFDDDDFLEVLKNAEGEEELGNDSGFAQMEEFENKAPPKSEPRQPPPGNGKDAQPPQQHRTRSVQEQARAKEEAKARLAQNQAAAQAKAQSSGSGPAPVAVSAAAMLKGASPPVSHAPQQRQQSPTNVRTTNPPPNNAVPRPAPRPGLRPAQPPSRSFSVGAHVVQAGSIPSMSIAGPNSRSGVGSSGGGFVNARGVKRAANDFEASPTNGVRAPLGEVEMSPTGELKRSRVGA